MHPLAEVEAVRRETLHARIEFELYAAVGDGFLFQPREQGPPVPAGAVGGGGDEVVDVEVFPGEKFVVEAVAGDGADGAGRIGEGGEAEAFLALHALDPGHEVGGDEVRTELLQHRETGGDFSGCDGEGDGGGGGHGGARWRQEIQADFGGAALVFSVVMRATAATMMAEATSVRGVIGSSRISQPRITATTGLT